MQVIELRHRLASDVIPVVQPLLEPGGVITGMDGTLFVRASPANLAQILQVVESLDRQPRQLLLSVGQGARSPDWIPQVLAARNRDAAAPTFSPDGLYFVGPVYEDRYALPASAPAYDWLP